MIYTRRGQLTIIELEGSEDSVLMERLKRVLIEYPSNMIYCEMNKKLFGIISMGDILRAYEKEAQLVSVNKKYTCVYQGEYYKAKKLLNEEKKINAIPVVSENGRLLGDYTRWNDLLKVEYLIKQIKNIEIFKKYEEKSIALVSTNNKFCKRKRVFEQVKKYLETQRVTVQFIEHSEVLNYMQLVDFILFVDENEIRACRTAIKLSYGHVNNRKAKLKTYNSFFSEDISISDEQCAKYLKMLCDSGIILFGLTFEESSFYKQLMKKIEDKFAVVGETPSNKLPKSMYKDFFDDLYSEEYAENIINMPVNLENNGGVLSLKDCQSLYYNVVHGERDTRNQADHKKRSIYFFGPCYIYGHYVEDKYTIESILKEYLLHDGRSENVVNCGSLGANIANRYLMRIMVTPLKKGDIVIIDRPPKGINGVQYIDLNRSLEENKVKSEWFVDDVWHCNHKVNQIYASVIYDRILPVLCDKADEQEGIIKKDEDFIRLLYLDRYFKELDFTRYKKIGSIVMNCNPFTYGHRHLIEQALDIVDFLIVFVVEEDKSFFSFAERFAMVNEGTMDLNHIIVVPSGPFILSQMSFPEYFVKETGEDIKSHTEQDIKTFAEKIASQIGIKYRFAGEEADDQVTNQYNIAMKKLLPKYGIEFIEIPRKTKGGKSISASQVRRCLEYQDNELLTELLPETTRDLLGF